jgi:Predicted redox protein, regulator of disulfide bond formation
VVTSISQKINYCTEITNSDGKIISDTTADKGGTGKYFRPHELLCAGLASCLNISIKMILDDKNIKYDKVVVNVDLDRSNDNKTVFIYDIDIEDVSMETKQMVKNMLKSCPVKETLSKEIQFLER